LLIGASGNASASEKATAEQLDALLLSAAQYQNVGQHQNAIAALQAAMPIAEALEDRRTQLVVMARLGQSFAQSGTPADAEHWLSKAAEMAAAENQPQVEASALNNLGNLLVAGARYPEAISSYRKTLTIAQGAGLPGLVSQASANAARAAFAMDNVELARQFIKAALQAARTLEPSRESAYLLINIATLQLDIHTGNPAPDSDWLTESHELLRSAEQIADKIQDSRVKSWAIGHTARLYLQGGRTGEALTLTREAEFIAQQHDMPELLFRWQWQAGRILDRQGKDAEAVTAYRRAVQTLQPIRYDVTAGYGSRSSAFREIMGPLYFELADLLLRRSGSATPPGDEEQQERLQEARRVIEQFKAAELEDYFQDDCVAQLQSRTAGLDQLEAHTAVIYPILLQDRTELLVSLPAGIRQFTVQVTADKISNEIRSFRRTLEKRTTRQYLLHAKRLHEWLISPIDESLRSADITTLVIVPDGALRTIPWGAMHDGKEFLVQKYAIAYTPGLEVTDPKPLDRQNLQVLLSGLTTPVEDFPPLLFVKEELDSIHKIYDGTVLLDRDYQQASMSEALGERPYSVVHIASHGQFSENPDQTFLLSYNDRITMDKLEQFIGIGRFRDKPVELLTLSACQTAAGDDRAALGLAGVAVKSGARSALATLWFVNDQTTSLLVSDFYRQLKDPAASKARALQKAQINTLSDPRYRHPGYWAPYLLIGNWL
jgi:CHAT domain-containing protein